jgi:hypothetical protein
MVGCLWVVGWLWWRDKGAAARPSAYKAGSAAWAGGSRGRRRLLLRAQAAVALPVQGAAVVMATRAGGARRVTAGAAWRTCRARAAHLAPLHKEGRLSVFENCRCMSLATLSAALRSALTAAGRGQRRMRMHGCRATAPHRARRRAAGSSAVQACRPLSAAAQPPPPHQLLMLQLLAWPSDAGLRRSPRCGVAGGALPRLRTRLCPSLPVSCRGVPRQRLRDCETASACVPNRLCAQCSLTAAPPECRVPRYHLHRWAHLTASAVWGDARDGASRARHPDAPAPPPEQRARTFFLRRQQPCFTPPHLSEHARISRPAGTPRCVVRRGRA